MPLRGLIHEQILLHYCGVVPNTRNSHLGVLKICKCLNCCPQGVTLTRTTRSRKKLTINDSLEEWNEAGRCPDMGAISSSQSSDSNSSSTSITLGSSLTPHSAIQGPTDKTTNALVSPTPVKLKSTPRIKQKSFKSDTNKLSTFRDIVKNRTNLTNGFGGSDDNSSASLCLRPLKPSLGLSPKPIAFKSHNGKNVLENSTPDSVHGPHLFWSG